MGRFHGRRGARQERLTQGTAQHKRSCMNSTARVFLVVRGLAYLRRTRVH